MAGAKPVAIITGASAGIGAALAHVFADHGHALVLVARRAPQLKALADLIEERGQPRPHVIVMDLGRPDAGVRIEDELRERNLEPQFVVNNAGFGLLGPAESLDRARQLAMIDLNVRVLTELSLRFIDSIERHRGGILNVGSVLGFLPGPGMAVYHATKAYVLSFSEALHQELRPRGIRVTALCPGPVDTEFQVRGDGFFSRKARRSVTRVAADGYRGLMAGRRVVVPGSDANILRYMARLLPRGLILSRMARTKRKSLAP